MKSRHTVEIEVEWDRDDSGLPHTFRLVSTQSVPSEVWISTEALAGLGITRPEPPYVPQVGDIVRLTDDAAVSMQMSHFYQVKDCDNGYARLAAAHQVAPHAHAVGNIAFGRLVFVARPA